MFWIIAILFLSSASAVSLVTAEEVEAQTKVCGNFCGPTWCANQKISEKECVDNGAWDSPTSGSCADACCKTHDYCCGSGTDRASCNDAIVSCITHSHCYWTLCGAAVWAAMKIVSDWCCGSACPTALINEIEARLNITGQLATAIANLTI